MAKNTYSNEIKEQAFLFWYKCRNDSEVVRMLKSAGYDLTRTTVASWRERYDWQQRTSNMDVKKQAAQDVSITFEESLFLDLQKQKDRYDAYFESLEAGEIDNQAMYVYNQILEKLLNLKNKVKPESKKQHGLNESSLEEIKRKILGIE